jgi:hypothetical protein
MTTPDDARPVRHFCGKTRGHDPHIGCNGFGYFAGSREDLCSRPAPHTPHRSCDGLGAQAHKEGSSREGQ